ncbi:conserved protein of unknown function [Methylorubrum extorquens]|uniref:Uncharacterized protein n=2 Tax=Methylorubrum extorquens TaxID=408 RepID=A0A2N9AXP2_METEX|nr:conserved protein of unknown function [Methylorubrum extorquens]
MSIVNSEVPLLGELARECPITYALSLDPSRSLDLMPHSLRRQTWIIEEAQKERERSREAHTRAQEVLARITRNRLAEGSPILSHAPAAGARVSAWVNRSVLEQPASS